LSKSEQLEKFKENIKANPDFYRQDFKNDYVAVVKQANANALAKYQAEKQEIENRRRSGDGKDYLLSTNAQYVTKDYIQGVYDQIRKGVIIIGTGKSTNAYFKDKDGLFYSSDSFNKLVKTEGAEGFTDEAIARMRGVDTFADEFGYEFTSSKKEDAKEETPEEKQIKLIMSTGKTREEAKKLYNLYFASDDSKKIDNVKKALQAPNRNP